MMRRHGGLALACALAALLLSAPAQADDKSRSFRGAEDKLWSTTRSILVSLGWRVENEDRSAGWILTKSRSLEGEDFGVYAKGTKHSLRVLVKGETNGWTLVTIERRVYKEERILWVEKEVDVPTTDRTVERQLLDAIGKAL